MISDWHKEDYFCIVCGYDKCDRTQIVGEAFGGTASEYNSILLCEDHDGQFKSLGIFNFLNKYPHVQYDILAAGFDIIGKDLVPPIKN